MNRIANRFLSNLPTLPGNRTIVLRKKVPKVYLPVKEFESILEQILKLLKEPYDANEEQLVNIPCNINDKTDSSYQLEFMIPSANKSGNISLMFYIKRKNGTLGDWNPYMVTKLNKNAFSDRQKSEIKGFIEKGIFSLILEDESRDLAETVSRYKIN